MITEEIDVRLDGELMHLRTALRERWRVIEPPPPGYVYHYTDLKGLAGIIASGSIWATLSSRLNDDHELLHASAELRRVLRTEAQNAHPLFRHLLLPPQAIEFEYARQDAMEIFVASLSSLPDHERQWSIYAREGHGVALGFRAADFLAFEELQSRVPYFAMGKVIYDPILQREFLSWVVHHWFERMCSIFPGLAIRSGDHSELTYLRASILGALAGAVAGYLPLMKSEEWAQESEWRLGHSQDPNNPHGLVQYRGASRIPFVPLDIRDESSRLPLSEVVIGPGFAREESVAELRNFLRLAAYENVGVRLSEQKAASPRAIRVSAGRRTTARS